MAKRGGQIGNQNATKGKIWTAAIERALAKTGSDKIKAIDAVAESLVRKGLEGDVSAIKEIGDRLEGKPVQAIAGENGGAITVVIRKFDDGDGD